MHAGNRQRRSVRAHDRSLQEGAGWKAQGTIEQNVIENHVLVIQTDAGANYVVAVFHGSQAIPSDGPKFLFWVGNWGAKVGVVRKQIVEERQARQVAVGASSIANIAQAKVHGEIGKHFPGVGYIEPQAVIGPQSSSREAKCRLGGGEALAVTDD